MDSKGHSETKIIQTEGAEYMATVVAQKWGNSLGIHIPKELANRVGISQGSEIELYIAENEKTITLKPKALKKKYTLEELLSQITPDNQHKETDFGTRGRELI